MASGDPKEETRESVSRVLGSPVPAPDFNSSNAGNRARERTPSAIEEETGEEATVRVQGNPLPAVDTNKWMRVAQWATT